MRGLRELFAYRDVLVNLVKRELKVRYKNSVLGFLWSLLNPLLQILVLVVAIKYFMGAAEPSYSIMLVSAYLPWTFFALVTQEGAGCVAEEVALVKKVYFPRALMPMATLTAGVIHFLLSLPVLIGMFAVVRVTVAWNYVPLFVVALVIQVCLMLGLILMLSALSVFYNDVRYILGSFMTMWLFLSPVLYDGIKRVIAKPELPHYLKTIYMLNPMAPILMGYRSIVPTYGVDQVPHYYVFLGISAVVAVLITIVGGIVFSRYQWTFAEHG